ncbi:hypothetical protein [Streptomyces sp. NPDC048438]|uniref:hypothetical protein n=1 Tax=Streptomyces sp. NPDC048438 TaxID=3365551 RepID=UPI00371B30BF
MGVGRSTVANSETGVSEPVRPGACSTCACSRASPRFTRPPPPPPPRTPLPGPRLRNPL